MWVPAEKRFVLHSLRTKDYDLAVEKAEKDFIAFQAKVQAGEKIFSLSASELVEVYLRHLKERFVATGQLSEGRYYNVTNHLRHYLEFIGRKERVQNYKRDRFRDYVIARRREAPDINLCTVRNEQVTILAMYKWALDIGYITHTSLPLFEKMKIPAEESKREGISLPEYRRLVLVSKNWHRQAVDAKHCGEQWYYRRLLHHFIVLQANFGFRTGELLNLRWDNVRVLNDGTAQVVIRAETTKVRKQRTVRSRRGDVFEQIRSYSRSTAPTDFVFSAFWKNRQWNKQMLYRHFQRLIAEVRGKYGEEFPAERVLYGLRHLFITLKLLGGIDPWVIARMCGTSIRQITATYNDADDIKASRIAMQKVLRFDQEGNLISNLEEEGK